MNRIGTIVLAATLAVLPVGTALAQSSQSMSGSSSKAMSIDVKTLERAKVQSEGKDVGKVNRVMVDPNTGRVSHVDITVTQGTNRQVSVPWSDLKIQQDKNGNPIIALRQGALESSPAASPTTGDHGAKSDQNNYKK